MKPELGRSRMQTLKELVGAEEMGRPQHSSMRRYMCWVKNCFHQIEFHASLRCELFFRETVQTIWRRTPESVKSA